MGLTKKLGLQLRFIAPLNPQANFVERLHRPLGATLRAMVNSHTVFKDVKNWHRYVPFIEHRLNEYKPKDQQYSPAAMVLGRTQSLDAPILSTNRVTTAEALSAPSSAEKQALESYADELLEFQGYVDKAMNVEIMARQEADHKKFNAQQKFHEYVPGDKVAVYYKRISSRSSGDLPTKLILQWHGPCEILRKIGPQLYKVRMASGHIAKITTDRLAPLSSNLMMPAQPQKIWKSAFPQSGADLFLVPGDQVVLLEIPRHLLSSRGKDRVPSRSFYVAEFVRHDDSSEEPMLKVRLKGCHGEEVDPYLAKHELAWKRKTGRGTPQVVFSSSNPDPGQFEPVELTVRSLPLLPLHAFSLTKGHLIPSKSRKNIQALLHYKVDEDAIRTVLGSDAIPPAR